MIVLLKEEWISRNQSHMHTIDLETMAKVLMGRKYLFIYLFYNWHATADTMRSWAA